MPGLEETKMKNAVSRLVGLLFGERKRRNTSILDVEASKFLLSYRMRISLPNDLLLECSRDKSILLVNCGDQKSI